VGRAPGYNEPGHDVEDRGRGAIRKSLIGYPHSPKILPSPSRRPKQVRPGYGGCGGHKGVCWGLVCICADVHWARSIAGWLALLISCLPFRGGPIDMGAAAIHGRRAGGRWDDFAVGRMGVPRVIWGVVDLRFPAQREQALCRLIVALRGTRRGRLILIGNCRDGRHWSWAWGHMGVRARQAPGREVPPGIFHGPGRTLLENRRKPTVRCGCWGIAFGWVAATDCREECSPAGFTTAGWSEIYHFFFARSTGGDRAGCRRLGLDRAALQYKTWFFILGDILDSACCLGYLQLTGSGPRLWMKISFCKGVFNNLAAGRVCKTICFCLYCGWRGSFVPVLCLTVAEYKKIRSTFAGESLRRKAGHGEPNEKKKKDRQFSWFPPPSASDSGTLWSD